MAMRETQRRDKQFRTRRVIAGRVRNRDTRCSGISAS